ncbi:hypothetical protein [Williamsia sp.]|uniref:hypothetical protein n=1 Tax=Williamsia sp. TaxID=1872085 RepID=UPI002F930C00
MPSPSPLDEARAALSSRQREVVGDLLAGRVPSGFDPIGSALTSDILIDKRASAARRAGPQLAELPQWRDRFRRYAQQTAARGGCAHEDVAAFTRWLAARSDTDRRTRDWLAVEDVYDGTRRAAWVRHRGRREFVLGIGSRTRVFAIKQAREGDKEGLS